MKLQPKQQVNIQVAAERKQQIDEGITIARKIDGMRETLANLEKQHADFVGGMEDDLVKRTGHLSSKVRELQRDVAELEERKRLALIPLSEEAHQLELRAEEVKRSEEIIQRREENLVNKELVQDKRDKKSKEVLARVNARDRESAKAGEEAQRIYLDAKQIHNDALAEKENQENEFSKRNYKLNEREKGIVSYEFTLKMREEVIETNEKENAEEKIRLSDERKTLERAINRIKK